MYAHYSISRPCSTAVVHTTSYPVPNSSGPTITAFIFQYETQRWNLIVSRKSKKALVGWCLQASQASNRLSHNLISHPTHTHPRPTFTNRKRPSGDVSTIVWWDTRNTREALVLSFSVLLYKVCWGFAAPVPQGMWATPAENDQGSGAASGARRGKKPKNLSFLPRSRNPEPTGILSIYCLYVSHGVSVRERA